MKNKDITWIIHYVANGVACDECGTAEDSFKEGLCNAHTHGLSKYGHLELQITINLGMELVGYTLNKLGLMISREGKTFKDGDVIEGMFQNNLKVKVKEVVFGGERLLRIIFPDKNYNFPDNENCLYPYNTQYFDENGLYIQAIS